MSEHDFCRTLLRLAREEAKEHGIKIPKGLTALCSNVCTREQWFIEAKENSPQVYVQADCAYDAKAKFIHSVVEKQEEANG